MQSSNVVSLRDGINYLGPVVCIHPRKLTFSRGPGHGMTRKENCVVRGPGHGMTRKVVCAGAQNINYLGPVVKPRDDKFFFLLFFFLKQITNIKIISK